MLAFIQRALLLVACQVAAVLLAAVYLNRTFAFYESWSDLFGTHAAGGVVSQVPAGSQGGAPSVPLPAARDGVITEQVKGTRSHVAAKIRIVLPPGYDAASARRYPVIVFLPGYPGSPLTWLKKLELQAAMGQAIHAGTIPPFIAVLPAMNIAGTRDVECTDIPHGPQALTWLAKDVPEIVASQTRAAPPGSGWGVVGYSTGGFCATKLLLTSPRQYGSASALSGYFHATTSAVSGDLFGGSPSLRDANDPIWLIRHRTTPPGHLLVMWSAHDPETAGPSRAFLASVRPPLAAEPLEVADGGHNTGVWKAVLPQVLAWFGQHLR